MIYSFHCQKRKSADQVLKLYKNNCYDVIGESAVGAIVGATCVG